MKIVKSLIVSSSVDHTWDFFQDVPKVAACFPGANLTEQTDEGIYKGNVSIKLGPFTATFDSESKPINPSAVNDEFVLFVGYHFAITLM